MPNSAGRAGFFVEPINAAMVRWSINTPGRAAAFLAQLAEESKELQRVIESLNYTHADRLVAVWPMHFCLGAPKRFGRRDANNYLDKPRELANYVYANRHGNGVEASGDGWTYRGRGPIEITFRDNYRACGAALGVDLLTDPDKLLEPEYGAQSAGWYWKTHGCNELADQQGDDVFAEITRRINGGLTGLEARTEFHDLALKVFS